MAELEDWLGQHPDTQLVVIDTMARFQKPPTRGNNVYLEEYAMAASLKSFADRHHVALLLIHHLRKEPGQDPLDEISGSTGITGAADTILIMKRAQTIKCEANLLIRGRDVDENELSLMADMQTKRWFNAGAAACVDISAERTAILDVLKNEGRPMGPSEVASLLGKPVNSVKQLMPKMAKDGQLVSQGGPYTPSNSDNQ